MRIFLFWNTNDVTALNTGSHLPAGSVEVDQSVLELARGVEGLAEAVDGRQGLGVHSESRPGVPDCGIVFAKMEVAPI